MEVPSDFARVERLVIEKRIRSNPYGSNGVTRAGMVPSLGCWAIASAAASRQGMTSLPINPPKVHNTLDERG
jgi:CO/xanthine dehydrogenase Mo-binding subunit